MQCDPPVVPPPLLHELAQPQQIINSNEGLLLLIAEYEALRRKANADRAAVVEIIGNSSI